MPNMALNGQVWSLMNVNIDFKANSVRHAVGLIESFESNQKAVIRFIAAIPIICTTSSIHLYAMHQKPQTLGWLFFKGRISRP